ncbi:hypothetical protein Tco_1255012 [Tanacetum coccineum]
MRDQRIAKVELASCEWGRSLRVMGLFDGAVVEVKKKMNSIKRIAKVELASCEWGRSLRVMGLFDGAIVKVKKTDE